MSDELHVTDYSGGRLTLKSGVPSTPDKSVLYFEPWKGDRVPVPEHLITLFDKGKWTTIEFNESRVVIKAPPPAPEPPYEGGTSGTVFDVFVRRRRFHRLFRRRLKVIALPWKDYTERTVPLLHLNKRLVLSTDHRMRYVGTIYVVDGVGLVDTPSQNHVFNFPERATPSGLPPRFGLQSVTRKLKGR